VVATTKSNKKSCSNNTPQVPLDVITQANALRSPSISLGCAINERDEKERVTLAQKYVHKFKMPRELSQSRPTHIYKPPLKVPTVRYKGGKTHDERTRCSPSIAPTTSIILQHPRGLALHTSFIGSQRSLSFNGHLSDDWTENPSLVLAN